MKTCTWTYNEWDDDWATECGNLFQFTDDGPAENHFVFCPYCGGRLKPVIPPPQEYEGEDEE